MNIKNAVLGTIAFAIVSFPLAVVWHVVLFEQIYQRFGYFDGEPNYGLGLLTIAAQGAILSFAYPYLSIAGNGLARGLKFGIAGGALIWTTHVLAFVAKQAVPDAWLFVAMETVYLLLQFGIFGMLIGLIFRKSSVAGRRSIGPLDHGKLR
jgi:hypothetical protein